MKSVFRPRQKSFPQHKFAIASELLGDHALLAWSNLGLWRHGDCYVQACQNMADHLAHGIGLHQNDHLLDLGCGHGASILHWAQHYHIQQITAVELQAVCVQNIQQQEIQALKRLECASFLALDRFTFPQKFTAIVCIDALYHHALNTFLKQTIPLLADHGRIGFHYLQRNPLWKQASTLRRQRSAMLLKMADVKMKNVLEHGEIEQELQQSGCVDIQIENLTKQVFAGFANYVQTLDLTDAGLAGFKIKMTAKLCRQLFEDGLIDYVQVTARKKH
ncbi:MAG: class I SAM-dependent methyltransferase [Acinetobacter sp.]